MLNYTKNLVGKTITKVLTDSNGRLILIFEDSWTSIKGVFNYDSEPLVEIADMPIVSNLASEYIEFGIITKEEWQESIDTARQEYSERMKLRRKEEYLKLKQEFENEHL